MWWRNAVTCHHVEQERRHASMQRRPHVSRWMTNWSMQSPYIPPAVLHLQQQKITNIKQPYFEKQKLQQHLINKKKSDSG
jgi:hypothetical protein